MNEVPVPVRFDEAYARYNRRMIGRLVRLGVAPCRAEEIAHDIWADVLRLGKSFPNIAMAGGYLMKSVRHAAAREWRVRSYGRECGFSPALARERIAGPEEQYLIRERLHGVMRTIAGMPDTQRDIFVLFICGWEMEECAARFGLSVPSVNGRIARARCLVRFAVDGIGRGVIHRDMIAYRARRRQRDHERRERQRQEATA